jgi:hypothetical protein
MYGHTRMIALPYACHASTSFVVKIIWLIIVLVVMTFSLYNMGFSNCRSMKGKLRYIMAQGLENTQHFVCNERPEHNLLHNIQIF